MENDLYYEKIYTKKRLFEVLRIKEYSKIYVIDTITVAHKHKFIWLPPYHWKFSLIEMIWAELKTHIQRKNTEPKFSKKTIALTNRK